MEREPEYAARRDGHRILVLTELFLPTKGGTAVWFDEVYRRLGGKELHIVTADVPGAEDHDAGHPNSIHRVRLERYRWLRPESLAMYAKFLTTSLAVGLRHPFDAVHAGRVLPEGLVAWTVARVLRRPLVIYAHGEEVTTWRQPGKLRAMIFSYRRADRIIANSEFTRDRLLELGVIANRVVVQHPGVDLNRFRPGLPCGDLKRKIGMGEPGKLIVSVGRLSRRKGFDQIIRALPLLAERGLDVHYAIIGIGDDRAHLEALAEELGVAGRVQFQGHVSFEDLARWYNAADVVAMPNREINGDTEGFGMVFIEAAACATPTLAGLAGGTASAVVDGVTGLRVDGSSVAAVAGGLAAILSDSTLAGRLGENGFRRAVEDFSWEKVSDDTRRLHSMLVGP